MNPKPPSSFFSLGESIFMVLSIELHELLVFILMSLVTLSLIKDDGKNVVSFGSRWILICLVLLLFYREYYLYSYGISAAPVNW